MKYEYQILHVIMFQIIVVRQPMFLKLNHFPFEVISNQDNLPPLPLLITIGVVLIHVFF
jgi:hypothetical protein